MSTPLYIAQRVTALLMAPLVAVHIALIIYAVNGGLTSAEILGRTRGSVAWAAFYGLFVLAAVIHGAIGLRTVLREWTAWRDRSLDVAVAAFAVVLLVLGWRAVYAVVVP